MRATEENAHELFPFLSMGNGKGRRREDARVPWDPA